jgi:RHS repeat-associated protein
MRYIGVDVHKRPLVGCVMEVQGGRRVIVAPGRWCNQNGGEWDILLAFTGDSSLTNRYLHGPGEDNILADEQFQPAGPAEMPTAVGDLFWMLFDNQGSVRDIVDSDGSNVVNHITYDAFGKVTSETAPTHNHISGFQGAERDEETGMQLHDRRYLDVVVGGWISFDPSGFSAGDTNLRRFVSNAPTYLTDPSGLQDRGPDLRNRYSEDRYAKSSPVTFSQRYTWYIPGLNPGDAYWYGQPGGNTSGSLTRRGSSATSSVTVKGGGTCNTLISSANRTGLDKIFHISGGTLAASLTNVDRDKYYTVTFTVEVTAKSTSPTAGGAKVTVYDVPKKSSIWTTSKTRGTEKSKPLTVCVKGAEEFAYVVPSMNNPALADASMESSVDMTLTVLSYKEVPR